VEYAPDGKGVEAPGENEPLVLHDLWRALTQADERSVLEAYHDAVHAIGEAQTMYTHGLFSLDQRARAERLYFAVCRRVRDLLNPTVRAHRDVLDELNDKLADKYFLNFSVFQSVPDVWGIDQVFPIVPLHRLDERPERRGVINDLTCDSDGRIDHYVGRDGVESTLALHPWKNGEEYLVGIFMVGAYQEILGDMHNLFGDTDSVNVVLTEDGGYRLESTHRGDTVDGLLRYVSFTPDDLLERYRAKVAAADLDEPTRAASLQTLAEGLTGYTYLEE
jgi:arginine decarboxylase